MLCRSTSQIHCNTKLHHCGSTPHSSSGMPTHRTNCGSHLPHPPLQSRHAYTNHRNHHRWPSSTNHKELKQCLKAVEQQLEHAKNCNAAIARRLAQPSKTQPQNHPPAKDKGASTTGATTKKLASTKLHPLHQQKRWVPPTQPQSTNASCAVADNASQPNRTTPGNHFSIKRNPKPNTWQTRRHK